MSALARCASRGRAGDADDLRGGVKQYVVIAAGGGSLFGRGDALVAFTPP